MKYVSLLFILLSMCVLGSILIRTIPAGAMVYVNGSLMGITKNSSGLEVEAAAGDIMEIVKPGYERVKTTLKNATDLLFTLTPLSLLKVTSDPTGAEVTVNGEIIGETPLEVYLPAGTHTVLLKKENFGERKVIVSLRPFSVKSLTLCLYPYGTVTVESSPEATLIVDGEEKGLTPITLELKEGYHKLVLEKTGYKTVEKEFFLKEKDIKKFSFELEPISYLKVTGEPSIVSVKLNGKEISPSTVLTLRPGTYTVTVEKEGFEGTSTKVVLKPGTGKMIKYELLPKYHVMELPFEAKLFVNGYEVLKGPGKVLLREGFYLIEIVWKDGKWADFVFLDRDMVLKKNETATLILGGDPLKTTFTIDEKIHIPPKILHFKPGEYRVSVTHEGKRDETTLKLLPGSFVELFPKIAGKGFIYVLTIPSGVRVSIDGEIVGTTPILLHMVDTGIRKLKLEGFKEMSVMIESSKVQVIKEMLSKKVLLKLRFDGADMFLDGKYLGKNEAEVMVETGIHELVFKNGGRSVYKILVDGVSPKVFISIEK